MFTYDPALTHVAADEAEILELYRSSEMLELHREGFPKPPCEAFIAVHAREGMVDIYVALYTRSPLHTYLFRAAESIDRIKGYRSLLKEALAFLGDLGFQMESLSLSYTKAMREVVIKAIPFIQLPGMSLKPTRKAVKGGRHDEENLFGGGLSREEARISQEEMSRRQLEAEIRSKIEHEARQKIEAETRQKIEAEARQKIEVEVRRKFEDEIKGRAEAEAKRKAEADAKRRAEEEAKRRAEEEAKRRAEEEAKRRAEEEAKHKAERSRGKIKSKPKTKPSAEVDAEREDEIRRRIEEEIRSRIEEEVQRRIEEEVQRRIADATREMTLAGTQQTEQDRLEAEAKRKAEADAKRRAEEEAKRKAEDARRSPEEWARLAAEREERQSRSMALVDDAASRLLGRQAGTTEAGGDNVNRPSGMPARLFRLAPELESIVYRDPAEVVGLYVTLTMVQLAPEDFPQQHCSAYVCSMLMGRECQIYVALRLRESRRTLVYVPRQQPANMEEYRNLLQAAVQFLEVVGFLVEPVDLNLPAPARLAALKNIPVLSLLER